MEVSKVSNANLGLEFMKRNEIRISTKVTERFDVTYSGDERKVDWSGKATFIIR